MKSAEKIRHFVQTPLPRTFHFQSGKKTILLSVIAKPGRHISGMCDSCIKNQTRIEVKIGLPYFSECLRPSDVGCSNTEALSLVFLFEWLRCRIPAQWTETFPSYGTPLSFQLHMSIPSTSL